MRLEELMRVLEQKIPWSEWKYLFKMATSKVVSGGGGPRVVCTAARLSQLGLAVYRKRRGGGGGGCCVVLCRGSGEEVRPAKVVQ